MLRLFEPEIDFEKDYLVINRDMQGNFLSFRWYPTVTITNEKITEEDIKEKIIKWNEAQKLKDDAQQA